MQKGKKIRVLVVDDSAFMRKAMKQLLETDSAIEVVATARDGEDGFNKARALQPDVVTMDVNMPGTDGLTALQYIVAEGICPVVMVSSLTQEGAMATFESLELGAFDYVSKPGGTVSMNIKKVSDEIRQKVKAAAKEGTLTRIANRLRRSKERVAPPPVKQAVPTGPLRKAVALGISTGGPKTLLEVLPELPADLGAAVFIVQHMPPNFTATFANRLDQVAGIPIKEVEAGDTAKINSGYLAKGGYHLLLRQKSSQEIMLRLSTSPEHLFVPSVGVMMESILSVFGRKTIAVLMTGMGDDGADAMVKIRKAGGITIAESEETACVFGMPREAIERGGAEIVAPSYAVAAEIVNAVKKLF
jgi:two-component system chemotaxis response regulator CheB